MPRARASAFTLVELMIVVVIIGVLSTVALPAFMRYVRRARSAEATINLRRLYDATVLYYHTERAGTGGGVVARAFPQSGGPAPPAGSCCAQTQGRCAPDPGVWQAEPWESLGFTLDGSHFYWYSTARMSGTGAAIGDSFQVRASGDLNCNGVYSLFQRSVSVGAAYQLSGGSGLYIQNDLE